MQRAASAPNFLAFTVATPEIRPSAGVLRIRSSTLRRRRWAAIASEPQGDDQVVEESGARVFLEPQAAELLGDKVLDAERDDNGELNLAVRD